MLTYEELLRERDELFRERDELFRRVTDQQKRIGELEKLIEELQRKGKRQAAPFSKGEPKADPTPPGRKPGAQYGERASRPIPRRVDEKIDVQCPLVCEHCQGPVRLHGKESQYQIDLPPIRPVTTEFTVHTGQCLSCGRRVQARHPRQTSSALGVGGVQIGPGVISWAAYLNKAAGLSYGKIADLLKEKMGLNVGRSTLCRALTRLTRAAEPSYAKLIDNVKRSDVVYPDETGWRIDGRSAWLSVYVTDGQTVYQIAEGRGFAEAARILGADYAGLIGVDGWAPYRRFEKATIQTCLAHLLRRCRDMQQLSSGGSVEFPRQVQSLLQAALAVRDRRDAGKIGPQGVRIAKGRLQARLGRLLAGELQDPADQRLAKHLRRSQHELFVFLEHPEVEATNWPAEQAIRPAVVNRKSCAGNRTPRGAHGQEVLTSVLRTCQQRHLSSIKVFTEILRNPKPRAHKALTGIPPPR